MTEDNDHDITATYEKMNLKNIQEAVSAKLCCKCDINNEIESFFNDQSDMNSMSKDKLKNLLTYGNQTIKQHALDHSKSNDPELFCVYQ